MSVDYYSCDYCGDTFCDCGDYVRCNCGRRWCSDECAGEDEYEDDHCKLGYDMENNNCNKECWECDNIIEASCKYCREEDFEDEVLLDYSMQLLGLSREDLINRYKKYIGK